MKNLHQKETLHAVNKMYDQTLTMDYRNKTNKKPNPQNAITPVKQDHKGEI